MTKTCPNCAIGKIKPGAANRTRNVAGHSFTAALPAMTCDNCGEIYFDGEVIGQFDLLVAARLAEAGVIDAEALKFMRKVTGLNGKEFAELLEVRAETVSRWEKDKRPIDRATYAVMRQLIFDRLHGTTQTADYLRSLHKPKRLPRNVKIDLHRAA